MNAAHIVNGIGTAVVTKKNGGSGGVRTVGWLTVNNGIFSYTNNRFISWMYSNEYW